VLAMHCSPEDLLVKEKKYQKHTIKIFLLNSSGTKKIINILRGIFDFFKKCLAQGIQDLFSFET
jgi:hypothetical protein